jgi:hypothetical protein
MPDQASALKAVRMLDLLIEYFGDGNTWTRGTYHNGDGSRCLVGAMYHLRAVHCLSGDPTRNYLLAAMPRNWRFAGLVQFNDKHGGGWPEMLMVLNKARHLALCDANGSPKPEIAKPPTHRENHYLNRQKRLQALYARIDLLEQLYADRRSPGARWITPDTYTFCPRAPEPCAEPQRLAA